MKPDKNLKQTKIDIKRIFSGAFLKINTIDEYSPQLWNGLPYKTERDPSVTDRIDDKAYTHVNLLWLEEYGRMPDVEE